MSEQDFLTFGILAGIVLLWAIHFEGRLPTIPPVKIRWHTKRHFHSIHSVDHRNRKVYCSCGAILGNNIYFEDRYTLEHLDTGKGQSFQVRQDNKPILIDNEQIYQPTLLGMTGIKNPYAPDKQKNQNPKGQNQKGQNQQQNQKGQNQNRRKSKGQNQNPQNQNRKPAPNRSQIPPPPNYNPKGQ